MEKRVTQAWLKTANSDPKARAMAAGAERFLIAHDVPHTTFSDAAKRGDYVSTVFDALERVGAAVRNDRIGDKADDIRIVEFLQEEIERAAKAPVARMTND